jgi:hypothetical protein
LAGGRFVTGISPEAWLQSIKTPQENYPLAHYERFYASIYSLEKTFLLTNLGQVDLGQPDPNPPPHRFVQWFIPAEFLRWFGWCQTVLGWILATIFAAGVTGVVRND